MASSGKKSRTKWVSIPADAVIDQRKTSNWEDEVAKEIDGSSHPFTINIPKVELPTAPKASRDSFIDESKIPTIGPFRAYISNIPYDLNEDELAEVFSNLRVKDVQLPRDEKTSRAKGFGYIEFEDRSSLAAALSLGDTAIKGRHIKIDLPNSNDMGRGSRGGMRSNRDRDQGSSDRTTGDWRAGPRTSDFDDRGDRGGYRSYGERDDRRREGGGGGGSGYSRGGFDREERGFHRDDRESGAASSGPGSWRSDQPKGGFGGGGGGRAFDDRRDGGSRFGDRDGGSRFGDRDGGSRFGDRDGGSRFGDREGGRFGDRDGGRFGDRDGGSRFGDRSGGGFEDRRDRDGGSRFGPPRRDDPPLERAQGGGEAQNRRKLVLQPRSKPIEGSADSGSTSASIFGGAKPVDTAAREREIEERLMKSEESAEPRSKGGPGSTGSGGGGREERRERQWEPAEKRVEPAPPPKENPWGKKAQPIVNNGRSSPEDDDSRSRSVDNDDKRGEREKRV